MNRNARNKLVLILSLITVPAIWAADVTWSGGDATWSDPDGDSFSAAFDSSDGQDNVTFNDTGSNTDPITVSSTVAPALKTFANSGTFYRLDSGTIGGTGDLLVNGGGDVAFGNEAGGSSTTPPTLSFTGNTSITNGSRLGIYHQTATSGTLSLGTGTVTVDGGSFGLHNTGSAGNYTFSNDVLVGANNGTFSFHGNSGLQEKVTFSGTVTLNGDFAHAPDNTILGTDLDNGFNNSGGAVFSGTVSLSGNRRMYFADSPDSNSSRDTRSRLIFSGTIATGGNTLTLDINGANSDARFTFDNASITGGGLVELAASTELRIEAGTYTGSSFAGNAGSILNLGNNTSSLATLNTGGGMTFGTAAGQIPTLRLAPRGGDGGFSVVINGDMTFDSGSSLVFYADGSDNFRDRYDAGTITMLDGSTIVLSSGSDHMGIGNSGGSAVMAFGDGNSATTETITISGRSATLIRPNNGFDQSDTGATILYNSTASIFRGFASSETRGGGGQTINLPFLEGAGGTIFAPADGTIFDARGPATGVVFTATALTKLTTDTGTVRFMNSGNSNTVGTPGEVEINAGGVLMGIGTYVGSTFTVNNGGTVAPGLSIGSLDVTGNMTFNTGSTLETEIGGRDPGQYDTLNVDGNLVFAGSTLLDLIFDGFTPGYEESWDIMTVTGTISGLENLTLPSSQYSLGLTSGDGFTAITLSKVPEPASAMILGLAGLLALRRRRA